jgi:hypothetical protein
MPSGGASARPGSRNETANSERPIWIWSPSSQPLLHRRAVHVGTFIEFKSEQPRAWSLRSKQWRREIWVFNGDRWSARDR